MKINLKNIALATLYLLISSCYNLILAAEVPPAPPEFAQPGGGGGGVGPGSPASPIDMYQIILFAVAIMLVAYFYKKTKLAKA